MLDARWQLWKRAHDSGQACGEPFGEGRWRVTCNLPPDHPLPHEARRGYGTVVHATWPWQPTKPVSREPAPGSATGSSAAGPGSAPRRPPPSTGGR